MSSLAKNNERRALRPEKPCRISLIFHVLDWNLPLQPSLLNPQVWVAIKIWQFSLINHN